MNIALYMTMQSFFFDVHIRHFISHDNNMTKSKRFYRKYVNFPL